MAKRAARRRTTRPARHEALERQIAKNPDTPEPYLIYGDWLQQAGDPRGELIALQAALERATGAELGRLKVLGRELLQQHAKHFFGPLTRFRKARHTRLDWFCGFVRALDGSFARDAAFLEHPSARFIQQLSGLELDQAPPLLSDYATTQDDLSWIWSAPRLKTLRIGSWGDLEIGSPRHAGLQLLHIHRPSERVLGALAGAELPGLRLLSLRGVGATDTRGLVAAVDRLESAAVQLGVQSAIGDRASFAGLDRVSSRVSLLALEHVDGEVVDDLRRLQFPEVTELQIQGIQGPIREALFTRLPALPRLRSLRLLHPSDLVGFFRGFAHSDIAGRIEALDVHVSKPGAGRALAEGRYRALTRLTLTFDPDVGAEYLQSHRLLGHPDAFPRLEELHIAPARHIAPLAGTPLAARLERLSVPLDRDRDARLLLDHLDGFPRLKTVLLDGERQLSPEMMTALFGAGLDLRWALNQRWAEVA